MINLVLSESERQILQEILENTLSDLRMEIANTDKLAMREMLRDRKMVLVKTLEAIESVNPEA